MVNLFPAPQSSATGTISDVQNRAALWEAYKNHPSRACYNRIGQLPEPHRCIYCYRKSIELRIPYQRSYTQRQHKSQRMIVESELDYRAVGGSICVRQARPPSSLGKSSQSGNLFAKLGSRLQHWLRILLWRLSQELLYLKCPYC
jgi:hypothetical protein